MHPAGRRCTSCSIPANAPPARDVVVWRSERARSRRRRAAARWLGVPRVAAAPGALRPQLPRTCNPDYRGRLRCAHALADGYPLLVIGARRSTISTTAARQGRGGVADEPLPSQPRGRRTRRVTTRIISIRSPRRRRADEWSSRCIRCQVTTTDQATAVVGIEPLPTLAAYRHNERLGAWHSA